MGSKPKGTKVSKLQLWICEGASHVGNSIQHMQGEKLQGCIYLRIFLGDTEEASWLIMKSVDQTPTRKTLASPNQDEEIPTEAKSIGKVLRNIKHPQLL